MVGYGIPIAVSFDASHSGLILTKSELVVDMYSGGVIGPEGERWYLISKLIGSGSIKLAAWRLIGDCVGAVSVQEVYSESVESYASAATAANRGLMYRGWISPSF